MKKYIKNNFFHGIMFHHFHDKNKHYKGQGSISANLLFKMKPEGFLPTNQNLADILGRTDSKLRHFMFGICV